MILVVGRPGIDDLGELHRTTGRAALAAAAAGAPVELVGSVGDDAAGDTLIVALGRAGIGHAAVMRDPTASTPGADADAAILPRLDASDLDLALRYLLECRVLVLAEPVPPEIRKVAADAAAYHGAALVAVMAAGEGPALDLPADAMQLESPGYDDGSFAALIGRYAAALDAGRAPSDAWSDALADGPWEPAG